MVKVTKDIINLIKKGESLNNIFAKTSIGKPTLYYHYKKINGKKYQEPEYKIELSEKEGEIVGIFSGDGSQHYYSKGGNYYTNIHFGPNLQYANYVKTLFEKYFKKNWPLYRWISKEGYIKHRLRVSDKKIYYFFKNYIDYNQKHKHDTVKLKSLKLPNEFKLGFLKGLLDTDGTISKSKGRIRSGYYTTSKQLAYQIKILMNSFNIESTIQILKRESKKNLFRIFVRAKDLDNFLNLVKPYKIKKLGQ